MKKLFACLLVLCLAVGSLPVFAEELPSVFTTWMSYPELGGSVSKYGHVDLDVDPETFLAPAEEGGWGFSVGDIVTVRFLDRELTVPVINNYSDVDAGATAVKVYDETHVRMCINMGVFCTEYGLAQLTVLQDGSKTVYPVPDLSYPVEFTFEMKEPGGYLEELNIRNLVRTAERDDYDDLTDEEFANFRAVETAGMKKGTLYRGSSPIDPSLGRNTYVDAGLKKAGVTVIWNLANDARTAQAYEGFEDSYASGCEAKYQSLGMDFTTPDNRKMLAEGFRFLADPEKEEETFFIHCTEGKDRTGFVCAVLECLMGASLDEVTADYFLTFTNFFNVEDGEHVPLSEAAREKIVSTNLWKSLETNFGTADLAGADLAAEAEDYLLELGLTGAEISQLRVNLGGSGRENPDTGVRAAARAHRVMLLPF